ncbi:MAG: winged helix-turn-helix domain-containing protein [Methanothrix sp.]|uniref:winged helix-turn-helix domain-containing protein n=1 Tax=Methanothrix sp. TaxID=90426 RepID=UPI003167C542|nr:winged helix-turn-helix domain-containing protein [Methanothrix sp.]
MTRYRPATKIVLKILECIDRNQSRGRAIKTHIIQCSNLKAASADRYLDMLRDAGYILERHEQWGERQITAYELTPLGRERYEWFRKINAELFEQSGWGDE